VISDRATARLARGEPGVAATLVEKFDQATTDLGADQFVLVAEDLASVTSLLARESVLTRHLADPADDPTPKLNLLETLLEGKVGDTSLEVLKAAVSGRWSSDANLVDAWSMSRGWRYWYVRSAKKSQATSKSNLPIQPRPGCAAWAGHSAG